MKYYDSTGMEEIDLLGLNKLPVVPGGEFVSVANDGTKYFDWEKVPVAAEKYNGFEHVVLNFEGSAYWQDWLVGDEIEPEMRRTNVQNYVRLARDWKFANHHQQISIWGFGCKQPRDFHSGGKLSPYILADEDYEPIYEEIDFLTPSLYCRDPRPMRFKDTLRTQAELTLAKGMPVVGFIWHRYAGTKLGRECMDAYAFYTYLMMCESLGYEGLALWASSKERGYTDNSTDRAIQLARWNGWTYYNADAEWWRVFKQIVEDRQAEVEVYVE